VPTTDDLFTAISAGDAADIERMLADEPSLASATRDGVTALRAAVYAGHPELVSALAARTVDIDAFDASAIGDVDRLRDLLDADGDLVRAYSPDGFTSLHLAAFFGHPKVAELLLSRGADPRAVATNGTGLEPLNSAAAGGQEVIAHLLLDRGADVDATTQGGFRPLHAAANRGDASMVALLLGRGADPASATDDGRTPADLTDDPAVRALLP
jgi:ankyrin repeat protein